MEFTDNVLRFLVIVRTPDGGLLIKGEQGKVEITVRHGDTYKMTLSIS